MALCQRPGYELLSLSQLAKVLADFDVVKEGGTSWQMVVKELDVNVSGNLEIEFKPLTGRPMLSGIEIVELKHDKVCGTTSCVCDRSGVEMLTAVQNCGAQCHISLDV